MRLYSIAVVMLLFSFNLALAQDSLTCLDKASAKIKPEEKISLVWKDGQKVTGRLLAIDLDSSQVTIHKLDEASRMNWARISSVKWGSVSDDTATFQASDLTRINHYVYGQLRPMPILGGTLVGALVGGGVGYIIGDIADIDLGFGSRSNDNGAEEGFRKGLVFGSVTGLLAGTIFSLVTPTTRKIECEEKEVAK